MEIEILIQKIKQIKSIPDCIKPDCSQGGDSIFQEIVSLQENIIPHLLDLIPNHQHLNLYSSCKKTTLTIGNVAYLLLNVIINLPVRSALNLKIDSFEPDEMKCVVESTIFEYLDHNALEAEYYIRRYLSKELGKSFNKYFCLYFDKSIQISVKEKNAIDNFIAINLELFKMIAEKQRTLQINIYTHLNNNKGIDDIIDMLRHYFTIKLATTYSIILSLDYNTEPYPFSSAINYTFDESSEVCFVIVDAPSFH